MVRRGCQGHEKPAATMPVRADVAELVDAHGSGPCGGNPVEVRVLSSALRRDPRCGHQELGATEAARGRTPRRVLPPEEGRNGDAAVLPLLAFQSNGQFPNSPTLFSTSAPGPAPKRWQWTTWASVAGPPDRDGGPGGMSPLLNAAAGDTQNRAAVTAAPTRSRLIANPLR